jgi:hypothetical protein
MQDLEFSFNKYNKKMEMKYNTDPKFKAMADRLNGSSIELGGELSNGNGYTFEDNDRSLETAANQWNTMGLWSVGMTASKTKVVNSKMMKVAQEAMQFGSDPVYGPWIQEQETILYGDIEVAFTKYDQKMQYKYNTDPKFKAMADKHVGNAMGLGEELGNKQGWTFEDNDGSLENAGNMWNLMGLWSVGMTASKTTVVNKKMMKVAETAMAFGSDPVYGPWIQQQ